MRIAFVSDVVYPYVKGGVEAIESQEMRALAKRHDVCCFSMRFEGMKRSFTSHGVHHIGVAPASVSALYEKGRRSVALARSFANGLKKELEGKRFDLVQANAFPFLHLGTVKTYCRATGCRLVIDVAEVWDMRRWVGYLGPVRGRAAYYFMRRALKGADHYMVNSSATKRDLERIGIAPGRISVFSPVLDGRLLRDPQRRSSAKRRGVIFAGRLIPEKRLGMWLDALAAARRDMPSMAGTIIGEGPEGRNIAERIKGLGLSGSVRMFPFTKTKAELYRRIAGSGLFLQTSSREGLSAIVLESLALGTPVLLPSDTPIPYEVKRMCVVARPSKLPERMVIMLKGSSEKPFLLRKELERFSTAAIPKFYASLFKKLGLGGPSPRSAQEL